MSCYLFPSLNFCAGGGPGKLPSLTDAEEAMAQLLDPEVVEGMALELESEHRQQSPPVPGKSC